MKTETKLTTVGGAIYNENGDVLLLSSIGWQTDDPRQREAIAEKFVRAVNNFDAMLEALEQGVIDGRLQTFEDRERWRETARRAIAKAKGA